MNAGFQERTKQTYSRQWGRFRIVRPLEDHATFRTRVGLDPAALAGTVVLDAGCGMGRYLRVAASGRPRLLVGIDLSQAVHAAADVTRGAGPVALLRGDLLRLPFSGPTFDHIYSLGVIDHTPDPRRAFLGLAQLLRPGGRIVVWVYERERPILEWIKDAQRAVSTRLPVPVLEAMSRLMAPLGGVKRRLMTSRCRPVQRLGVLIHLATLGVSLHPDPEVRICDTLDWYAPRYMSRHTLDEVRGWFAEAGLVDIEDLSRQAQFFHEGQGHGINLAGRRPG
ncbi:MAG: methyltransferase [Isosphaeraceae bacterium]|jgi:SAM-dependent methyltransferase|nr:MAG: methyltransferase [Isosphaeraceae bacterium]